MDEPLSNLDAALRVEMRGEIRRLHRKLGVTTVYVTHDQVEAMSLAERVIVMNRGKIIQQGKSLAEKMVRDALDAPTFQAISPDSSLWIDQMEQEWEMGDSAVEIGLKNPKKR